MVKKLLLLVLLAGAVPAAAPEGLELKLELADAAQPAFRLAVVNHDKVPHKIVKTGDGSESSWREPALKWTGEIEQDGKWTALPLRAFGRCGLYDSDWHKDVVEVKPGQKVELGPWATFPPYFKLPEHGRLRFTATYVYAAGETKKEGATGLGPGPMGSTPAFTLTSAPLVFTR